MTLIIDQNGPGRCPVPKLERIMQTTVNVHDLLCFLWTHNDFLSFINKN